MTPLSDRQEMVWLRRGFHCVNRDLDVAIGTVLKTNRARQARGELTMDLALCCTRTNSTPGHEVRNVLRRDHVQELTACGQAQGIDF